MKKLTLLILSLLFATVASAQFLLGTQFNFNSITERKGGFEEDIKNTTTLVTMIPRVAYASGSLWYGLNAGVSQVFEEHRFVGTTKTKKTLATIAPFLRYTKRPLHYFGIWIEGEAGTSFGNARGNAGEKTAKYIGLQIGLRSGLVFFIDDQLSFEASFGRFGYTTLTTTGANNGFIRETVNQRGFMLNTNANILDEDKTLGASIGFQFGANWLF